jgi:hypothetical protein
MNDEVITAHLKTEAETDIIGIDSTERRMGDFRDQADA